MDARGLGEIGVLWGCMINCPPPMKQLYPHLFIDGQWVDGAQSKRRTIQNPATLEKVDEVVEATAEDVRRACSAAAAAQRHWRKHPAIERAKLLHDAARLMREDRARLSELLTLEGGKPRIENLDEVEWCAACFDYYAEIARNSHGSSIPPVAAHQVNFTIKEPLGVVGCIVPFNYPLLLMTWKVAPAIAAGNTVVIKPSRAHAAVHACACARRPGRTCRPAW